MLTASQALSRRTGAGRPLPPVWQRVAAFSAAKIRGQLHLTASAPGVGKSILAINEAVKMGEPTLYVAGDSDEVSMSTRLVQVITGCAHDDARYAVLRELPAATRAVETVKHLRLAYPNGGAVDEIVQHVWAYAEVEGRWPSLIVVDNLMDFITEESAEEHTHAMNELAMLARSTQAAVHVLHHVTGQYEDGRSVVPMSGLRFKVSKKPSLVMTLFRGAFDTQMHVSVVKNRVGPSDPAGNKIFQLHVDYARLQITDPPNGGYQ